MICYETKKIRTVGFQWIDLIDDELWIWVHDQPRVTVVDTKGAIAHPKHIIRPVTNTEVVRSSHISYLLDIMQCKEKWEKPFNHMLVASKCCCQKKIDEFFFSFRKLNTKKKYGLKIRALSLNWNQNLTKTTQIKALDTEQTYWIGIIKMYYWKMDFLIQNTSIYYKREQ